MSTTTVPIQPIAKGSLLKLWGGVAAAALLAAGLAWYGTSGDNECGAKAFVLAEKGATDPIATKSGLRFQTVKAGKGGKPSDADVVLVNYKGSLKNGTEFDAGQQVPFPVQGLVPGFSEALKMMQPGGSYRICLSPKLGYGAEAKGDKIPANSTLLFEVDLLDFKSMAEVQAMQQQMQKQQGGPGGIPGGGMPGGAMPGGALPSGGAMPPQP
jgi:FKBP-type peptidyl-prolyl cis-trans isomerase FkpA